MIFGKHFQTLKGNGDAITKATTTSKEIKIADDIVVAESIKLTSKDIYRAYWHCRDFEITHLWQRSVFLTAFMVLCFSAYGHLAADMLAALRTPPSETYWLIAHGGAILISLIGTALSLLWIMMAKGSKAWVEIYESAIAAYEENDAYVNEMEKEKKIGSFQFDTLEKFNTKLNEKNFSEFILNSQGGAYSPSRINWTIGLVTLFIWAIFILAHIIFVWRIEPCWSIGFALISVVIYALMLILLFSIAKSKTLSDLLKK